MASVGIRHLLESEITSHGGMKALEAFGTNLRSRPLERSELLIFLATTSAFFREIPSGIVALALRVTDDWIARERFGAVAKGATILYSAIDEFGLQQAGDPARETHHHLFLEMAERWGFSEQDLAATSYILDEGEDLGIVTSEFYRRRPIPAAVGFHVASEITSNREFVLCYEGFRSFPYAYRLAGPDEEALKFYYIHTVVEPMHGATALAAAETYASGDGDAIQEIMKGALAFMRAYGRLFEALNQRLFPVQHELQSAAS